MKLLIFSDSHYAVEPMAEVTEFEKPDAIIHLGDMWDDAAELERIFPKIPLYHVAGNCDSYRGGSKTDEIRPVFEGVRFFCAHGHRYNVKMTYLRFLMKAMEEDARVALFGHTHVAFAEEQNGVLLLNPGTCRGYGGTYAVIDVNDGKVQYRLCKTQNAMGGKML